MIDATWFASNCPRLDNSYELMPGRLMICLIASRTFVSLGKKSFDEVIPFSCITLKVSATTLGIAACVKLLRIALACG